MDKEVLKKRFMVFAIAVIKYCNTLPQTRIFDIFRNQMVRCSTSTGANYRAACRAKSNADFINKLKIVEEELDEAMYFLEIVKEFEKENIEENNRLFKEANELLSIIVSSIKTSRIKANNLN
jgi:four helix bundle protein